ncbi:MAG: hypothetical protein OXC62_11125 [Aestuariivita sp.]|nr:hypothetical protein [Aestuariivita sp.]
MDDAQLFKKLLKKMRRDVKDNALSPNSRAMALLHLVAAEDIKKKKAGALAREILPKLFAHALAEREPENSAGRTTIH